MLLICVSALADPSPAAGARRTGQPPTVEPAEAAASERAPAVGALARVGETVGGAVVTVVEVHPEYERYTLDNVESGLFEVTTGSGGLCDHAGLTLFPRPELLQRAANPAKVDAASPALCARLAATPPKLRARAGQRDSPAPSGSPGRIDLDGPFRWNRLHFAIGALVVCGLALVPKRVRLGRGLRVWSPWATRLVGIGAFAALTRLVCAPVGITNGNLAGYEKLIFARGTLFDTPYGAGWGAIMGLVPGWPDGVFVVTAVFATLSTLLLADITRTLRRPDPGADDAGVVAGLFLAALPVHVGVSASETMHVTVLALVLVGVAAALRFGRDASLPAGLAAALAAGLAINVRPDAVLVLPAVILAALVPRLSRFGPAGAPSGQTPARWLAALPSLAVLATLAWQARGASAARGTLSPPDLRVLLPWVGAPEGARSFQLFLHTAFTPPVLWGLALFGAVVLRRRLFTLFFLLVWALGTTVPLAGKVFPLVDAIRLQLGGQAPWLVLAAIGVTTLPRWVGVVAILSFSLYFPLTPWVQTEEWQFLRRVVPTLPPGPIHFAGGHQREGAFAAVMESIGPARWSSDPSGAPEGLRYVGLECRMRVDCPAPGGQPVEGHTLEGAVDLDAQLSDRHIGFWRVDRTDRTPPP